MKKQQESLVYKVIKSKTNPFESTIEVSGIVNEFTPHLITREIMDCEKYIKEIEANIKIKEATKTNIISTNPIVTRMSDEDLCACYLYYEAHAFIKEGKPKLKELKEQIIACRKQLSDIQEQTGLNLSN